MDLYGHVWTCIDLAAYPQKAGPAPRQEIQSSVSILEMKNSALLAKLYYAFPGLRCCVLRSLLRNRLCSIDTSESSKQRKPKLFENGDKLYIYNSKMLLEQLDGLEKAENTKLQSAFTVVVPSTTSSMACERMTNHYRTVDLGEGNEEEPLEILSKQHLAKTSIEDLLDHRTVC